MKSKLLIFLIFSFLLSAGGSKSVDGEYIMGHIQDDRLFEIFNPLDHNDSNYGSQVTKDSCKNVYKEYKKKYIDKKIKWMDGNHYESKNLDTHIPIYKKVVWHCKDEYEYDPETATKEEKANYERCNSDATMTAACGDGYYFTKKVKAI